MPGGRGGRRNGAAGVSYANRSDLNAPKPLAPTAAPGQTYGQATTQLEAQKAIPMAPAPSLGGAGQGPGVGNPSSPPPGPVPGATPFDRSTERPGEPVTSGLPIGAGPGPSPGFGVGMPSTLAELAKQLGSQPNAPSLVRSLAQFARVQT